MRTGLRRLADAALSPRSPARHRGAWMLAIGGPALVALPLLPFRATFGLGAALFCMLLVVVAVALIGGARPALLAIAVGLTAGGFLFALPHQSLARNLRISLVAMVAFVVVGATVGILVDELARLAQELSALRRVAELVARAAPPEAVFAAVTEEIGRLLPVDFTNLSRCESDGTATVVAAWSRDGRPTPVGSRSELTREEATTPVVVGGRTWGIVTAGSATEQSMSGHTAKRLADFTDLLATAIANAEVQAELVASRARLVVAADGARRRIERDLHDGTQQRLVSLALELRAAETTIPPGHDELRAQLSRAARGLAEVMEDLQEVSRGIHPAILSKGGLGPAIKTLARRSATPVTLDSTIDRRLPEPVEVAVYYVVSEALTNAAKHANASTVHIVLGEEDRIVALSISDDGGGGADPSQGSGLIGLRDRVEALGGTIEIASAPGAGTSMHAAIPVDPA